MLYASFGNLNGDDDDDEDDNDELLIVIGVLVVVVVVIPILVKPADVQKYGLWRNPANPLVIPCSVYSSFVNLNMSLLCHSIWSVPHKNHQVEFNVGWRGYWCDGDCCCCCWCSFVLCIATSWIHSTPWLLIPSSASNNVSMTMIGLLVSMLFSLLTLLLMLLLLCWGSSTCCCFVIQSKARNKYVVFPVMIFNLPFVYSSTIVCNPTP